MKEIACLTGVELLMDYLEGVLPDRRARCARGSCGRMRSLCRVRRVLLRDATDSAGSDRRDASRPRRGFAQRLSFNAFFRSARKVKPCDRVASGFVAGVRSSTVKPGVALGWRIPETSVNSAHQSPDSSRESGTLKRPASEF